MRLVVLSAFTVSSCAAPSPVSHPGPDPAPARASSASDGAPRWLAPPPATAASASSSAATAPPPAASASPPPDGPPPELLAGPCGAAKQSLASVLSSCRCAVAGRWGRPPKSDETVCLSTPSDDDRAKRFLETRMEVMGPAKSGQPLRVQLRWVNASDGVLRVRFTRDTSISVAILDAQGQRLPIEGPDTCAVAGVVGMAEFSEITLPKGGEVTAETSFPLRRLRRKGAARSDLDCETTPGSALPRGAYLLAVDGNPRWLGLPAARVPLEVR